MTVIDVIIINKIDWREFILQLFCLYNKITSLTAMPLALFQ